MESCAESPEGVLPPANLRANAFHQVFMVDVIKTPLNIGVYYPFFSLVRATYTIDFLYGIVGASARAESIAYPFKKGFPAWL